MTTTDLTEVRGVGPALEGQLHEAGYDTVADLAAADPSELTAMRGIGAVSARHIIAAAAALVPNPAPLASPANEPAPPADTTSKKKPKKKIFAS